MKWLTPIGLGIMVASLFTVACRNYVLGYPYPWDHPKSRPRESDLAVEYTISKIRLPSSISAIDHGAKITLKDDGSVVFDKFPHFDGFGQKVVCYYQGSASWKLDSSDKWSLVFEDYRPRNPSGASTCDRSDDIFGGFLILGRRPPYRLYEIVGDPDSDTGIEFESPRR